MEGSHGWGRTRVLKLSDWLESIDRSSLFASSCTCLALDATRVARAQGFIGSWAGAGRKMGKHGA